MTSDYFFVPFFTVSPSLVEFRLTESSTNKDKDLELGHCLGKLTGALFMVKERKELPEDVALPTKKRSKSVFLGDFLLKSLAIW